MKQIALLFVAALLGAAVSLPAQRARDHQRPTRSAQQLRGHWENRCERVLVPGHWRTEQVPASYGWIYTPSGYRYWGRIQPAGCRRVWVPDCWQTRTRRVWVTR